MISDLKNELIKLADERYRLFSSSLLPDVKGIVGVRLPLLRKIAKRIAKSDYKLFLTQNDCQFFELIMIEAMVIGEIKNYSDALFFVKNFIPKINCWSVCDTFCSSIKSIMSDKNEIKKMLETYLSSDKEYELRFCFVILLMYFVDNDYEFVFNCLKTFNNNSYYAKMAAAWCLSVCFVKHFDECAKDISRSKIMPWVVLKGITKAIESHRLSEIQKDKLRVLRKNIKKGNFLS